MAVPTNQPRPALPAILAAGLVGAAALPVSRTGIGWSLTAFAVAGVIVVVGRRTSTGGEDGGRAGDRAFRAAMGLVALVLTSACALRAAGWIALLCLTAAAALASYALVGGAGWTGLARAAVALPLAAARAGLDAVPRSHAQLVHPGRTVWRSAAGIAVGAGAVAVFGALFRAADPVYADLVDGWTAGITRAEVLRAGLAFGLTAAIAAGAAHLVGDAARRATGRPRPTPPTDRPVARWDWIEWAVPLFMLDALFTVFVYVQLTVLFAGHPYVLGPGGPTYAEYARAGFTELLTVTILTLGVFAALARFAGRATRSRRVLLRLLGGALGGLTLVIVASALRRMAVYAEAYGFTRPRLLADAVEVLLGLVFVFILLAGVRLRATWLPRAALAAGAAVLLGLATLNPDAFVARTIIGRYHQDGHLDAAYLGTLSADAVAEIDKLPEPDRSCILAGFTVDLDRREPWYGWNAGRQAAREILRERPAVCSR